MNDRQWDEYPHNYVFLGDYVDRGSYSTEVLITLLCMKCNNPNNVTLLRGNHESSSMTKVFGFYAECLWKYDNEIYRACTNLFKYLPIAMKLDLDIGSFFLCHAGISPSLHYLSQINNFERRIEPPDCGLYCDLLWSDPLTYPVYDDFFERGFIDSDWLEVTYIENDSRDCSYYYGYEAVRSFLENNEIRAVIRGHECVDGVEQNDYDLEDSSPLVFTVFSTANYDDNNRGGVLYICNTGMKVKLYNDAEKRLLNPIVSDGFRLSMPKMVDLLKTAMDNLMVYAFNYDSDDDEDDDSLTSFLESDSSSEDEKEEDKEEEKEDVHNALADWMKKVNKSDNNISIGVSDKITISTKTNPIQIGSSPIKINSNETSHKVFVKACGNDITRPIENQQEYTPLRETTFSLPSSGIVINKQLDSDLDNENDRYYSLISNKDKKKRGHFDSMFLKRNESIPLTLSALREAWSKSKKDSVQTKETSAPSSPGRAKKSTSLSSSAGAKSI